MRSKGNYGLDSPGIVASLFALGVISLLIGIVLHTPGRWLACGVGGYFLLAAAGMVYYSRVGKLALRERLLDKVPWRGDERVLDVGCGRGLLTVAAAQRLSNGRVVGVDIWQRGALSNNQAKSVLENAVTEGVRDKIEVQEADARKLPFANGSFDVVVSNFVVHEQKNRADREQMMSEAARVLRSGGRLALVDFIFTDQCVEDLRKNGVEAERIRDGAISFWVSAILNFGAVKTYHVVGRKS